MPADSGLRLNTNPVLHLAGQPVTSVSDMTGLYQQRICGLGMSPAMMFYSTPSQHHDKLAAISHHVRNLLRRNDSVLDIGCGYGQLVPYLPECGYLGVDVVDAMVAEARRRYPRREFAAVEVAHLDRYAQWAILAGVLNSVPDPRTLLASSWRHCTTGLVADLVRHGTLPATFSDLNRFHLNDVARFLQRQGARRIAVVTDAKYWSLLIAWKTSS